VEPVYDLNLTDSEEGEDFDGEEEFDEEGEEIDELGQDINLSINILNHLRYR
jgi:hypothetical protein